MHIRTTFPLVDTVDQAFECLYWEGAGDENVEAFASRWGGLDLEHFRLALEKGTNEEQTLAIFALGLTTDPEMANLISPFLFQTSRMQRGASAICLGLMKDTRSFPVLERLLLDGLDLEEYTRAYQEENSDLLSELTWCGVFRWHAVQLLESWDIPSLVPTMKKAFTALWHIQQKLHPFGWLEIPNYDVLAYTLGQRGDFTVLDGLDLPQEYRSTAMIYMALGSLQARVAGRGGLTGLPSQISGLFSEMITNDALQTAVAASLGLHFGLTLEEQENCLTHFYDYAEMRKKYGHLDSDPSDYPDEDLNGEEEDEDLNDEAESIPIDSLPLCIYRDHLARIQSIAWSPESTHLVSGSEDGSAHVWNIMTGETITTFGHAASVNQVSWSPQGRWIASGGSDRKVCIWDAQTGEQINTYSGHQSWIWGGLAWSPDNTRIASASLDGTVRVWDALSSETLLTYRGHTGIVTSLAWSPDGTRIVSGGGYPECAIQIWNTQTGELLLTYRDHQQDAQKQRPLFGNKFELQYEDVEIWLRGASSVHGLAWSPDGTRIASAGLRTVCRVWNAQNGENVIASNRTDGALVWSPDGTLLSSTRYGHQVDIWHATTDQMIVSYHTQGMSDVKALGWSPDGRFLAASGKETGPHGKEIIQVWKV